MTNITIKVNCSDGGTVEVELTPKGWENVVLSREAAEWWVGTLGKTIEEVFGSVVWPTA